MSTEHTPVQLRSSTQRIQHQQAQLPDAAARQTSDSATSPAGQTRAKPSVHLSVLGKPSHGNTPQDVAHQVALLLGRAGFEVDGSGSVVSCDVAEPLSDTTAARALQAAQAATTGNGIRPLTPPRPPRVAWSQGLSDGAIAFAHDVSLVSSSLTAAMPSPETATPAVSSSATATALADSLANRLETLSADVLMAAFLKLNVTDPNHSVQTLQRLTNLSTSLAQLSITTASKEIDAAEKRMQEAESEADGGYGAISNILSILSMAMTVLNSAMAQATAQLQQQVAESVRNLQSQLQQQFQQVQEQVEHQAQQQAQQVQRQAQQQAQQQVQQQTQQARNEAQRATQQQSHAELQRPQEQTLRRNTDPSAEEAAKPKVQQRVEAKVEHVQASQPKPPQVQHAQPQHLEAKQPAAQHAEVAKKAAVKHVETPHSTAQAESASQAPAPDHSSLSTDNAASATGDPSGAAKVDSTPPKQPWKPSKYWSKPNQTTTIEINGHNCDFIPRNGQPLAEHSSGTIDGFGSHDGAYEIVRNNGDGVQMNFHIGTDAAQTNDANLSLDISSDGHVTVTSPTAAPDAKPMVSQVTGAGTPDNPFAVQFNNPSGGQPVVVQWSNGDKLGMFGSY